MSWKIARIDGLLSKEDVLRLVRDRQLTRWSLVRGEDESADRPLYLHPAFAEAFTPLPEQSLPVHPSGGKPNWRAGRVSVSLDFGFLLVFALGALCAGVIAASARHAVVAMRYFSREPDKVTMGSLLSGKVDAGAWVRVRAAEWDATVEYWEETRLFSGPTWDYNLLLEPGDPAVSRLRQIVGQVAQVQKSLDKFFNLDERARSNEMNSLGGIPAETARRMTTIAVDYRGLQPQRTCAVSRFTGNKGHFGWDFPIFDGIASEPLTREEREQALKDLRDKALPGLLGVFRETVLVTGMVAPTKPVVADQYAKRYRLASQPGLTIEAWREPLWYSIYLFWGSSIVLLTLIAVGVSRLLRTRGKASLQQNRHLSQ